VIIDPTLLLANRTFDLLEEANRERLAAQLPRSRSAVRHTLATTCVRLANWLDDAEDRYLSPAESGREDWVHHSASV
jgi:hypothetical protein